PGNRPLAGGPDTAHRKAKATGEFKVALAFLPQQLDEYYPLPLRQGHDGVVETVALVTERGLGARIAVRTPGVDQPDHVRLAEQYLSPHVGGDAHTLTTAN